jgi:hypothetical protein
MLQTGSSYLGFGVKDALIRGQCPTKVVSLSEERFALVISKL